MEKPINIIEILKDVPEGTPLYSPICGTVILDSVNDDYIYTYTADKGATVTFFSDGKYVPCPDAECMLFPSKDNRDWDTFNVRQNFKKGDIVARVYDVGYATVLLMGETDWRSPNNTVRYICYVDLYGGDFHVSKSTDCWCTVKDFYADDKYRLATDDEKKKLLDAIDKNGFVWDEVKLELRKKDEKPNFKKGDFVVDYVSVNKYVLIVGDGTDWADSDCDVSCICYMRDDDKMLTIMDKNEHWGTVGQCARVRYATEEERQQLLVCIVNNGYVWDSEKLELRKKVENPKFKKGDIITCVFNNGAPCILLMDDTDWSSQDNPVRYICYKDLGKGGRFNVSESNSYWCTVGEFEYSKYRPATDLEKHWLIKAMNKHGYVWDEKKFELRKKEHVFKPFDKVLVRDVDSNAWNNVWKPGLFGFESEIGYYVNGAYWLCCIPYEGNEHLLGTTDSPDEKGDKE